MTYQQAIAAGRKWAQDNRGASKRERDMRVAEVREAWGDDAAHGFWRGATEDL